MKKTHLSIVVSLIMACSFGAESTDRMHPEPQWARFERMLAEEGYGTTTEDLMKIARTLQHEDAGWQAIEILGLRGETAAVNLLKTIVDTSEDHSVRESAALALARLGDAKGFVTLRELLVLSAESDQAVLATRLARLGDASGYDQALELSRSADPDNRVSSLEALVALLELAEGDSAPSRELVDQICHLGLDTDKRVRWEFLVQARVVAAAGQGFVNEIRQATEELLQNEEDPRNREKAARVLGALSSLEGQ